MSASQNQAVLERLRKGPLTALDALKELGTARLAARVFDLRIAGWDIDSAHVRLESGKYVARYTLRSKV